jgi:hypothetical protein
VANDVNHANEVDVDEALKLLRADLPEGSQTIHDGGVVNEQIRWTKLIQDPLRPGGDSRLVGDIDDAEVVRRGIAPLQRLDVSGISTATDDRVPVSDKTCRQGAAQSPRGSCQYDSLARHIP